MSPWSSDCLDSDSNSPSSSSYSSPSMSSSRNFSRVRSNTFSRTNHDRRSSTTTSRSFAARGPNTTSKRLLTKFTSGLGLGLSLLSTQTVTLVQASKLDDLFPLTDINNGTFIEEDEYKCKGFQVTAKCDPVNGRHEKRLGCQDELEAGQSGYCICKKKETGVMYHIRHENCNHVKFTCEDSCRRFSEFKCRRFVKTKNCNDMAKPEDAVDLESKEGALGCDDDVDVNVAGYCECGGGRLVVPGQCHNPKLSVKTTCNRVCQRGPSPYEELGTHKWASDSLLKSNFRKLSLKYHPDKRPMDKDKFNGIREAMDLLGDKTTKVLFDLGSYDTVQKYKSNKMESGDNLDVNLKVDLESMYIGKTLTMNIGGITKICGGCHKTKSKSPFCVNECTKECPPEIEIGWVQQGNMRFQTQNEVPSKLKCRIDNALFEVEVEKGMRNGDTVRSNFEIVYVEI